MKKVSCFIFHGRHVLTVSLRTCLSVGSEEGNYDSAVVCCFAKILHASDILIQDQQYFPRSVEHVVGRRVLPPCAVVASEPSHFDFAKTPLFAMNCVRFQCR